MRSRRCGSALGVSATTGAVYLWLLARRVPAGSQRPATGSLGYLASGLVLPAGDVAAATDLDVAVAVIAVTTAAAALTGMTERVLAATLPPHRLPTRRQWAAVVGPAAVAPVATLAYAPAVWAPSTLVVATLGIVALLLARLLADAHIHQHAAAQAEERSTVDALTGLPNRAAALEEIDGRLAGGDGVAVIFCDLDGFKGVNDLFGHAAGDSILVEVAARLRSVDGAWSVARHSGDEFLAVCDPADVDAVGQRLRAAVSAPYQIDVISRATLTPSLGAAASCDLSDDPRAVTAAEIVDAGDKAMYEAKRAGKDQLIRHGTRVRAANLATDLREAMLAGEVGVRYEPALASDTMRPVRFEARPQAPPRRRQHRTDDHGLGPALAEMLISQALADCAAWRAADAAVGVSVDLSARQLLDATLVGNITLTLETFALPPPCRQRR